MRMFRFAVPTLLFSIVLTSCASQRAPSSFAINDHYPILLAHRSISQAFPSEGVERDTCTTTRTDPPTHEFLENTIASMKAAIAMGADVIEIDLHPTTDVQFSQEETSYEWTALCCVSPTSEN
jgi:glycerophosphoryl diester phosphodiesterase